VSGVPVSCTLIDTLIDEALEGPRRFRVPHLHAQSASWSVSASFVKVPSLSGSAFLNSFGPMTHLTSWLSRVLFGASRPG
jgi:hypothetical protein